MKNLFPLLLCLCLWIMPGQQLKAQTFGDFGALLEQLTDAQRAQFLEDLKNINLEELTMLFNDADALRHLQEALEGANPIADLGNLAQEWEEARALLALVLGQSDIELEDQGALTLELDRLNEIWNESNMDLAEIFNQHDLEADPDATIDHEGAEIDPLLEDLLGAFDDVEANGLGNFEEVLGQLFNRELFTSLEFAYGRKEAQVRFYKNNALVRMNDLQVLRVATVPNFETTWEARWSASASWTESNAGDVIGAEQYNAPKLAFNPFIMEADFAVMYNPGIELGGDALKARMITSLGFEVATYVPAHLDPLVRRTWENVGNTTGYGAQAGVGVAVVRGPLTTYTMGTMALGVVEKSELYQYSSMKFTAGVRYGDAINVRYDLGQQDWAPQGKKRIRTMHQVTVGILLQSLFR